MCAKILSRVNMVVILSPMIAPSIGGALVYHLGWRAPFNLMWAMSGLVLLGSHFYFQETCKLTKRPRSLLLEVKEG